MKASPTKKRRTVEQTACELYESESGTIWERTSRRAHYMERARSLLRVIRKGRWFPLTRGKFRADDQALYADYQQDCHAQRRWHRMLPRYVGKDVAKHAKRHPHIKFRRMAR